MIFKAEMLEKNVNTLISEIESLKAQLKTNSEMLSEKDLEINKLTINMQNLQEENKTLKNKMKF